MYRLAKATSALVVLAAIAVAGAAPARSASDYNPPTQEVRAVTIDSLTLSPSSVTGGSPSTGTVKLAGSPFSRSVSVSLSSSATGVATVPSSVPIQAGQTSGTFQVTTFPQNSNPNVMQTRPTVTITASASNSKSAGLYVSPPVVKAFGGFSPMTGGQAAFIIVRLTGKAPSEGASVALETSNSALVPLNPTVTVPANQDAQWVNVTPAAVTVQTTVQLKAHRSSFDSKTFDLTLLPPKPNIVACGDPSLSNTAAVGGSQVPCRAWINGPAPTGGWTLNLSSSNPAVAVPSQVKVDAGHHYAPFTATTSAVAQETAVTITSSRDGVSASGTIRVQPPALTKVTLDPSSVTGGSSVSGKVTLSGSAPSSGVCVQLSSTSSVASVASPVCLHGTSTGTFTVSTTAVSSQQTADIRGTLNGVTKSAQLTVNPPPAPKPDLYISRFYFVRKDQSCSAAAVPYPGNANGFAVCAAIRNGGSASAGASTLHVDKYTSNYGPNSDSFPGSIEKSVGAIAAGAEAVVEVERINQLASQVRMQWTARADYTNAVPNEQSESNNASGTLYTT
jgi:hypothetical protein